ncbi:hypothetical protein D9613_006657 [Agrocybe pediades]|uniref:NAD(P)-binding protein n=1 Tax=Agrocybe pediades TaxID=84607 RepID=A0A8H4QGS1_9AGAR|nr:hypothetical protein D9613_006657 [Agrocybe pediades]
MQLTLAQFILQQRQPIPPVFESDLQRKTVIVTGASNGIGQEAAIHFARMKPKKLILACRNKERGEAALKQLKDKTGCEAAELWTVDLLDFDSVKAFARRVEDECDRLDILVENAGILPPEKYTATKDGWEPCFQVNNLSTSLLALLLLPRMMETAEEHNTTPRLVVVSSEVHYWSKIDKKVIDAANPIKFYGSEDNFTRVDQKNRYPETKLMNILFVRAFNEHLREKKITIDSVNPGYCYSGLRANYKGAMAWFDWFMEKAIARTAEEGSRQLIWAALGGKDKEDELKGAYVSAENIMEPSDFVISEEGKHAQEVLWDNLIRELTHVDPKVKDVVQEYLTLPTPAKKTDPNPLSESVFDGI